jgi:hypothetical protein
MGKDKAVIPKIVHYVWVGPDLLPQADSQRIQNWRKMLPDWEFRAWENDNLNFSSVYLRMAYAVRAWNRVSDYTRMDALFRFGGVYLDTDVDLLRSLDSLLDREAFLGFQTDDNRAQDLVNGAVFGARSGHWLPGSIRDYFNKNLDGRDALNSFSGPGLITLLLRQSGLPGYSDEPLNVADITIFPKRYFYPYSWLETYSNDAVTPDTYAVHRWSGTWKSRPSIRAKIRSVFFNRLARYAPESAFRFSRMLVTKFGT